MFYDTMKIETLKTSELKPYKKNARTHPERQIDVLSKNIERFGFTTPLLVDEKNNVIAGHGRLMAMEKLGRDEVPCVRIEGLSKKEIDALRLADNKIASMSDWNEELLAEALQELDDEMREMAGFDTKEITTALQEYNFKNKEIEEDSLSVSTNTSKSCPNCGYEI